MRDGVWGALPGQLNQNLSENLKVLRRRFPVIVYTTAVIMALVIAFIFLASPQYTAFSQIVFDSKVAPNSIDLRPILSGEPPDEAFILSEVDVIRSRSLAKRVIDKLRLDENPDFDKSIRPDGLFSALIKRHVPEKWRIWEGKTPSLETHMEQLVDEFQRSITVSRNNRSRTVNINFTASTPRLAADALNTLAEFYLVARMEDRLDNAKRASVWLTEQIQDLREKAGNSEKAVEDYRSKHNLFGTSQETLISKQIGELNTRLTDAVIERRTAEANLLQVNRLLNGAGAIDATPQVMQSELIRKYREEELALEQREAYMTEEYGDRHPVLIQLRAEKQRLEEKMQTEIRRIAVSLNNQAQMARDRENSLQGNLQNVKALMANANEASIGLRTLERQAEASKILLERMMSALLQTSAGENAKSQTPDARLISTAPVPQQASFPPKLMLLFSGFIASTFIGGLLAFVVEHLDGGFRSAEQVEAICGLPVLAQVPVVRAGKSEPAAYALNYPRSSYAASIHAIYTRLLLIAGQPPPKVLLFTSARPGEGKSTISLSVARQQAMSGRRVVFVEADLHLPCIARVAGVGYSPGLMDVLSGAAKPSDVIQSDSCSTVDLIVAGTQRATHIGKPLGDIGMVIDALREVYDVIVLDAPPVLGLADANIFSAMADATLMIVQWGKTNRQVFKFGVGEITKFSGRIDGVILSRVDTRRQAYYGYGDSGAYTGEAANAYVG
jgi:capsular exopolysaccharide synthesis family protein